MPFQISELAFYCFLYLDVFIVCAICVRVMVNFALSRFENTNTNQIFMSNKQKTTYSAPELEVLYDQAVNLCLCASEGIDQLQEDNSFEWTID